MPNFDATEVADALREHRTISAAASALGQDRRRLSEFIRADVALNDLRAEVNPAHGRSRSAVQIAGDDARVDLPSGATDLGNLEGLITSRGLDPGEWYVTALKVWETYHGESRTTALLKRLASLAVISPARHVPEMVRTRPVERIAGHSDLIVVEGDHQAPYHDPGLDACATAFWRDTQPHTGVFLGDTADFPTISRHPDHPAASATPQECVDEAYGILRRRVEASPSTLCLKLKGNHDWRIEGEMLARSERMHGLRPAGEVVPALSLRRLLQLDALGIELVEDARGWEHAEVVLVPGGNGLVVRHGFVTGEGTAKKTMAKLGRSVIVGHGHQKESAWRLVYPKQRLQWGVVAGTMSRCDGVFPHFAVNPGWMRGFVTVERWPNGTFNIEHATYQDDALYWRDRIWRASDCVAA